MKNFIHKFTELKFNSFYYLIINNYNFCSIQRASSAAQQFMDLISYIKMIT